MSVTGAESNSVRSRAVLSDEGYLLLHEVRLRGFLELDESSVHAALATQLVDAGLAAPVRRAIRITAAGRSVHEAWARVESGSEAEGAVARGYERFLPLNVEFLRVCHDWQVRTGNIPNDHRDASYDWAIVDRLRDLDERAAAVLRRVGRAVDRFAGYPPRLRGALAHLDEGDLDWFTSPRIDSYHTVWMQLHEDLLLALGRQRGTEPQP
jgi:hypothetical protein